MQGRWYRYFLVLLKNYYKFKRVFIFLINFLIFLEITSILIDIYCGYFPNIFKNIVFWFYILQYYNLFVFTFIYWKNHYWWIFLIGFLCFWFFFRSSIIDWRVKTKDEDSLNQKKNLNENVKKLNIKQRNLILKKKLKKIKELITNL